MPSNDMQNNKQSSSGNELRNPHDDGLNTRLPDKSRYEVILFKIKNNWLVASLLIVGAILIGLASFTESITKLDAFLNIYFGSEIDRPPVTLFIDKSSESKTNFSIANTQQTGNVQLTSIAAKQLVSVDLCRSCEFHARKKLQLSLSNSSKVTTGEFELFDTENNAIFGEHGVYSLSPGESTPFSIQVNSGGDRGSVFHLTLSGIDLNKAQTFELIPPYLFYFIGPPDYRAVSLKGFGFDSWLREKDSYLRTNAARALGRLGDIRGESSLLIAAKKDEAIEVRVSAILALGRFRSKKTFDFLIAALSDGIGDKDEDLAKIRRAAAEALGDRNDVRAAKHLLNSWKNDEGFWVANESIKSYGKLNPPGALAQLTNILSEHDLGSPPEWQSRSSIVESIGFLADSRAVNVLIQQLFFDSKKFDDHWSRSAAARALRNCYKAECIEALKNASKSGLDSYSQREALESLQYIKANKANALGQQ